jgi:adenine-specific DNA methylase/very-short-patch-repair endonuclease
MILEIGHESTIKLIRQIDCPFHRSTPAIILLSYLDPAVMTYRKKLIEVALPLEVINKESAREKSIRHGHPSTLHLWWARRPLAACRAVLFASLVDDPSSLPEEFPTEVEQNRERQRLFRLMEELVKWENINNPEVLNAARTEILKSTGGNPPPVYDPFCGGGSIPLEAQRLGLEAHGSDLNPVAVLITKALIEIPPKFKDRSPVNPDMRNKLGTQQWFGAQGLAEDVRYYGAWMRERAFEKIGHLYPKVRLPQDYGGGEATVIAWLWARTVKCPNPGCGCVMPLVRSFQLSTKKGKEAWVEPVIDRHPHPLAPSPIEGEGDIDRWEVPDEVRKRMVEVARQLRKQQTPSEGILWEALRGGKLEGRKFRRQQPIGAFVVDFFCAAERLVVEVDGGVHTDPKQQLLDHQRQSLLESLGLRFVRLAATTVENNLKDCLNQIQSAFHTPLSPSGRGVGGEGATPNTGTIPVPPPLSGRGVGGEGATPNTGTIPVPPPLSGRGVWGEEVRVSFVVKSGKGKAPEGTVGRKGAKCIACGTPVALEYVRQEGRAGRMGAQLMAIVAEGPNGRVYLSPQQEHVEIAESAQPTWKPDANLPHNPRDFKTPNYGMRKISDLFTPRQLVALTTFSDLVAEAREKAIADAKVLRTADATAAGLPNDDVPLAEGGTGARAYGEAISVYLGMNVSRLANRSSSICFWDTKGENVQQVFARQAIPMNWDFTEGNPFSNSSGNFLGQLEYLIRVLENSVPNNGKVDQHDATLTHSDDAIPKIISTDPPYCLAPDTLIQTSKGYVPIQDIQIGDLVLTHEGRFSPVINTSKRWYEGEIYHLTVAGINHPLIITGEHPIYGIQTNPCGYQFSYCHPDCSYLKSEGHCRHQAFANYQLDWIPASQAKPCDLIFLPTLTTEKFDQSIALQDWLPEENYLERDGLLHYQKATSKSLSRREQQTATVCLDRQYTIPAHLKITPNLCRLVGFFVAEGYARLESDGGTIQFTLHWEEQNLKADIIQLMQTCFGLAPGKTTDNRKNNNNSFRLNFYSKPIATLFRKWFYTEEGHKCLPQWVLELPAEFLEELVKGYWWGDGYRANNGYKAVTVSPALAGQIQLILQKLGIRSCLHTRTVKSTIVNGNPVIARYPQHNITVNGPSLLKLAEYIGEPKHESLSLKRFSQHGYWWNNGYLAPIRKVERKPYIGYVYNLETVDHSYTTAMGCVHNCDNIGYADLSDFFYVWLRRSLGSVYPNLFTTLLVPKTQELVSNPYRFEGSKKKAKDFFEEGIKQAFSRMRAVSHDSYPVTIFYAFKQQEEDPSPPGPLSQKGRGGEEDEDMDDPVPLSRSGRGVRGEGRASTGWETMLEGLMQSGLTINGTWPMRTELTGNLKKNVSALASSIVLVCRPRPADAPKTTRRQFLTELQRELPNALKLLQQGNIAPVDLAQASIGPGMAVYSRYAAVLESDGSPLTVRTALQLINQALDDYFSELEGEFDSETRWALTWFEQHQFNHGPYGDAETLSKAKNTSIESMEQSGILTAKSGKVQLIPPNHYPDKWDPTPDDRISHWELTHHLIRALLNDGEQGAGILLAKCGSGSETARDLAYRLYSICDRKGWAQLAIDYNSLVISWPEIKRLAADINQPKSIQTQLEF